MSPTLLSFMALVVGIAALTSSAVCLGYLMANRTVRSKAVVQEPEPVAFDDPVSDAIDPLPIDPANPPKTVVFRPHDPARHPSTHPVCNCHGRPINVGDEMVRWPLPGQDGVLLFHAAWLQAQGMEAV